MLTPSTPVTAAYESSNTARTASVEASARAAYREENQAGAANEARVVHATQVARQAAVQVPDVMNSLSTVAVAGALNSLPAALNMMRNIVTASASGTLSEADRRTLHDDYAQLSQKVVGSVGSVGAGAQAGSSTAQGGESQDPAGNMFRESRGETRSTPTSAAPDQAPTVQRNPLEHTVDHDPPRPTDAHAPRRDVAAAPLAHDLKGGADGTAPRHQAMGPSTPSAAGHVEPAAGTAPLDVAQAERISRFRQVAQAEHVAPVIAVA